ncbi:plasmid mobilization protein [Enterobacter cloacae]|nr:plasmid mobilization protein [Enterobacter cloacae]
MTVKSIRCVSGGFSGGLLPVLPFCRQKRPERVSAVRVMRRYGKSELSNVYRSFP